ncbi:S41 family peptidase [Ornithinibacillus bavariensis]|uniref:Tail specific protease domain-containing protein n=1 Tax=Ornithinibacillus bavariensis TaxID=545502 RepID=A0A920C5W4_9BACI|nr:S41 family peptidase [Ornithinibacillus bavariensis]GIO27281.1 hypothetical protein J43TS3_18920 [Ornithinibacillus bavariensis]
MYLEIFQEIVHMMHNDYAGYIDKKGWDNPQEFEKKIMNLEYSGELNTNLFAEIVEDYLIDFKDPHLFFQISKSDEQKEIDYGFRVRRFKDKLYITSVSKEQRLKLGDAIISLNNIPIQDLVERHQRELMETKAEREDWRKIIQKYSIAEVLDTKGKKQLMELKRYEKAEYVPEHSITKVDSDTLCLKITDFFSADPIEELVNQYKSELKQKKNLIIDVRVNYGGSTLAYASLEKYIFPSGSMKIDFLDYEMEFNCTDRNAELMIESINDGLDKIDNEEHRKSLEQWKETWVKNKGKGFVSFEGKFVEVDMKGLRSPENIILLIDNYCGSAGDIFVYLCKKSPKVIVVGRPTMGLNDYSNLAIKKWHDVFELYYPTSRLKSLDHRGSLSNPGIKPDIYIPWSPEHIYKDVDMEEAIRILKNLEVV